MPWNLSPSDSMRLVDIVKGIASFGSAHEREALMSIVLGQSTRATDAVSQLDFGGSSDVFARRVISHFNSFGQIESGEQSLELILTNLVVPRVDVPVGREIHDIINRCKTVPKQPPSQPGSTPPGGFDPRTEDVAKAIRRKFDAIKDSKVLDENDQEVELLRLVSQELGAGAPSSGKDLSAYLAAFLTGRKDVEDCGNLVWRVFDLLCNRGKKEEAKIIGEVVDLMLPFSLPWDILNEAWRQLQDHGAVLIQSSVAKKAGAEILVAGLFKKPTSWSISSPEPTGQQLVGFEDVPIGDPDRNEESALRDLYLATYYPNDREKGTSTADRLTAAQMREDLCGRFRSRRLGPQRPSYCVVTLASSETDRQNQAKLLSNLAIPHLLFIELKPDSKTREFESFVIDCLNIRLKWATKGFPV